MYRRIKQRPLLISALLPLVYPVTALTDEHYLSEEDLFADIPTISGASHFPQQLGDAPVSVSLIDQDLIRASGAQNIPELFRLVPGFQAYIVDVARPAVNYHALPEQYPHRLEVKVDGRSVYDPLFSAVLWENLGIELDDIDYIEVIRGANAAADGSNSFNGSINIITKSPQPTQGTRIRATAGSGDTRRISATHSQQLDTMAYRLTAQYHENSGFDQLDDDNKVYHLGLNTSWTPNLLNTVNFQLGINESELGISTSDSGPETSNLVPWEFDSHFFQLDWRHQLDNGQSLNLFFYHNHMQIEAYKALGQFSEVIGFQPALAFPGIDDFLLAYEIKDTNSDRYDLELRHTLNAGEAATLSWGGAARYDEIDSPDFFNQRGKFGVLSGRAFANLQYDFNPQWLLNLGAMLEHREDFGFTETYRYSLNYKPQSGHSFRMSYNDASRAPTLLEQQQLWRLYQQGYLIDIPIAADPHISEETLESIELGYLGSFLHGNLTLDLKIFSENNRGLITRRRDNIFPEDFNQEVLVRDNNADVDVQGFEGQLILKPHSDWRLHTQITWLDIEGDNFHDASLPEKESLDSSSPEVSGSFLASYQGLGPWELSSGWYYQSSVEWHTGSKIDSFDRFDARIARQWNWSSQRLYAAIVVQNVFDEEYSEFYGFNDFSRRIYLELSLDF